MANSSEKTNYVKGELTGRAGVFAVIDNNSYRVATASIPHFNRLKIPVHVVFAIGKDEEGRDAVVYISQDRDWKPGTTSAPRPPATPVTPGTPGTPGTGRTPITPPDVEPVGTPLPVPGELTIAVKINIQNFENIEVGFTGFVKTFEEVRLLKGTVADIASTFGQTDVNTKRYVVHAVKRIFDEEPKHDTEASG